MSKQIQTVGFEIPGYSDCNISYSSRNSLMDADLLVISPESINLSWSNWIQFTAGGGCYDIPSSENFMKNINHFQKELSDFLEQGKNIFIFLSKKEEFYLATSVSHPRKGQNNYSTTIKTNYDFLPVRIGKMTSASGKHISYKGNPLFSDFYRNFKNNLEYKLYVEDIDNANVIFTGKDDKKILGAIYKAGKGNIITLPYLSYDEESFIENNEGEDCWTSEAIQFGKNLTSCLLTIDKQLTENSNKSPTPEWAMKKEYINKKTLEIQELINENVKEIEKINSKIQELNLFLSNENSLNDLLFEQGKPLEEAVIKALNILGYEAENYNDGVLELDQVITSPEGQRYIGECEGKDSKDINITKFRQLIESLNADFARDEVQEKALGILFGNPQRFEEPSKRDLDFTEKCKIGAEREKIALIKTPDLFFVVQYLRDNENETLKKECRDAIYNGLGKIVEFPKIPKQ